MTKLPRYMIKDSPTVGKVEIFRPCTITGQIYNVEVNYHDLMHYKCGAFIQDAFHYLSADEREFIKNDLTPTEYFELFKDLED